MGRSFPVAKAHLQWSEVLLVATRRQEVVCQEEAQAKAADQVLQDMAYIKKIHGVEAERAP